MLIKKMMYHLMKMRKEKEL